MGDLPYNLEQLLNACATARAQQSDLLVFPELALTGYPPEDLLFRQAFLAAVETALLVLQQHSHDLGIVIGHPARTPEGLTNRATFFYQGKILAIHDKCELPNTTVFDECRYFMKGTTPTVVTFHGQPLGILVCEDIWRPDPLPATVAAGATGLIVINASPFAAHKAVRRRTLLSTHAKLHHVPIIYVNCVGGQDELIFDGGSQVIDATGQCIQQLPFFEEAVVPLCKTTVIPTPIENDTPMRLYTALTRAVSDYVNENGFQKVWLGLSGGIDSALTLAIAVDALGADRVHAVMMPSRYTADMSREDAHYEAHALGVDYQEFVIEPIFSAFIETLQPAFAGLPPNVAEENLQARIRGNLLMALSNKHGGLVLITSNKSEMAVGYSTLYGDMAGGFAVLKDVYKTDVYALAHYRNQLSPVIPDRVLTRPPTAELAPNQTDQDTLPPYDILDAILHRYLEKREDPAHIIAAGFDKGYVHDTLKRLHRNEYKRRQAPIGPRVSESSFGKDRRYPITQGFSG